MCNCKVAVAASGLLWFCLAADASAQSRPRGDYQNEYGNFQNGQFGGNRGYNQPGSPSNNQRYYTRRVSRQSPSTSATDAELASWLLVDNRGEIQLAHLAQERASCDDVKEFAEKLVQEHSQVVEDLQQFAGRGRSMQPSGGLHFMRLKQQLGQQCAASAERELEDKDGDEFDKCFIGMQIAKHMEMLDTLKVFSRYASSELDELIEDAEQKTEEHLKRAKQLIKQLENDDSSRSSRASDRSSGSRDESSSDRSSTDRSSSRRENRGNRNSKDEG
jgi:putative membrane protein